MANEGLYGETESQQTDTQRAKEKRKQWLRSIAAGAGMLVVTSLGAVLVFDWYFFSIVDQLATTLQPIAGALHRTPAHAQLKPSLNSGDQPLAGEHIAPFSQNRDRSDVESLVIPVRSANQKAH
jgi:hypothetical protein